MKKCTDCPLELLECNGGHCFCTHKNLNNIEAPREIHNLTDGIPDWCPIKEDIDDS